jgi:hypothetical protein
MIMKYKAFGNTGEMVSILGFGMMRLPIDDQEMIIKDEAITMVRHGIDNGINYIDTAWPYHKGNSETLTGEVLRDGYREKVYLATKLPTWLIEKREDFDYYLDEQLKRLETDHIDFYLIHNINNKFWNEKLIPNGLIDFLESLKDDSRVKHIGFSFHDNLELFKTVVDSYDWDFCQIQLNYLDEFYQAGIEGMKYASDKGLGVIAMEPLRGGNLASGIPENILDIWKRNHQTRTPVEWALKYVWNQPEISILLSGMSNLEQVKQNIEYASREDVNMLTLEEQDTITAVSQTYKKRIQINCTACKYCMPCPNGVDIPSVFKKFNDAYIFNEFDKFKEEYHRFISVDSRASKCVECGICIDKCPQNIDIISEMKRVSKEFE